MQSVTRAERVWTRILGVLLVLLGLVLLASPQVAYTRRQKIPHSRYSVKTEKVIIVPRAAAVLTMGAGAVVLILSRKGGARD